MSDLVARHRQVISPAHAFDSDIEVVSGEGSWVTDVNGKRYLDFTCGIAVSNLGHQPQSVKQAILEQLDRLWHAGAVFRYESIVRAGERLRQVTPEGIDTFFFMNSGAEAVEASVKLARKTTGRQGVVVFRGGFHGRTMGAVSYTTSKARYRQGYHPLVGSVFVSEFPRPFRGRVSQEEATARAVDELDQLLTHEITPEEVACFLIEPLQGEGGYYSAGRAFLHHLRELADEHGILLVFDEVQSGFGRTGEWFTSQVVDVRPDVLVMGKAIANGLPLSAIGAAHDLMSEWPPGSHGTTFGGNPVSCASAAATIEALASVVPQVPKLSDHAFDRLEELNDRHATIGDVRGLGLMIGVELVGDDGHTPNQEAMGHVGRFVRHEGMFLLPCGPDGNVIRFVPPLTVSTEELDLGIDIIDRALTDYEGGA